MSDPIRYAGFTVRTECSHCGNPLPLHGPLLSVLCPSCLKEAQIPEAIWQPILEAFDEIHQDLADRGGGASAMTIEALPVRHEHKKRAPACEKCGAPFAVHRLPVGTDQDFSCTQCGDPASTHPVPEWLRRIVPTARQFYSTDPGAGRTKAGALSLDPETAIKPVVMACPSCGGSLAATAKSERIMSCRYCRADVYLPDEVWRRLHPVAIVKEWFIRFEGKTRTELAAESQAIRDAERQRRDRKQQREQAERNRRDRLAVEAVRERDALESDREITRMKKYGYIASLLLALDLAAISLASMLRHLGILNLGVVDPELAVVVLLGSAGVILIVALVLVARPIKKATQYDTDWMVFCIWFWVPFSLFMPAIGQLMALVRAVILFRGKFGASTITTNNVSTCHYDAVRLERAEARPAAIVFLTLALLYPLTMASLFAPKELHAFVAGDLDVAEMVDTFGTSTNPPRGLQLPPPK